jgi:hypothetical protein
MNRRLVEEMMRIESHNGRCGLTLCYGAVKTYDLRGRTRGLNGSLRRDGTVAFECDQMRSNSSNSADEYSPGTADSFGVHRVGC